MSNKNTLAAASVAAVCLVIALAVYIRTAEDAVRAILTLMVASGFAAVIGIIWLTKEKKKNEREIRPAAPDKSVREMEAERHEREMLEIDSARKAASTEKKDHAGNFFTTGVLLFFILPLILLVLFAIVYGWHIWLPLLGFVVLVLLILRLLA